MSDRPRGSERPVEGKCGAKLRGSDPPRYCVRSPLAGRDRCKLHGGATPRGHLNANTITGRHSRDLPTRLAARFAERLADPEILSLLPEVALIDARLGELLASSTIEPATWDDLRAELQSLRTAIRDEDAERAQASLRRFTELIERGSEEAAKWRDIFGLVDKRRTLVDTERKLAFEEAHAVRLDQILVLQTAITAAIMKHVLDPQTRLAIARDLEGVFG